MLICAENVTRYDNNDNNAGSVTVWQQWGLCHLIITPAPAALSPRADTESLQASNKSFRSSLLHSHTWKCHHIRIQQWLRVNEVCGSFYALPATAFACEWRKQSLIGPLWLVLHHMMSSNVRLGATWCHNYECAASFCQLWANTSASCGSRVP